jgi:hypothetical protein
MTKTINISDNVSSEEMSLYRDGLLAQMKNQKALGLSNDILDEKKPPSVEHLCTFLKAYFDPSPIARQAKIMDPQETSDFLCGTSTRKLPKAVKRLICIVRSSETEYFVILTENQPWMQYIFDSSDTDRKFPQEAALKLQKLLHSAKTEFPPAQTIQVNTAPKKDSWAHALYVTLHLAKDETFYRGLKPALNVNSFRVFFYQTVMSKMYRGKLVFFEMHSALFNDI